MKIILISGKSAHGKDFLASCLKEEFEKNNQKVLIASFGTPVKWFAKEYFNYTDKTKITDRSILTWLGTEIMRKWNENYWCEIIGQFVAAIGKNNIFDIAIIPDLRFHSEYLTIYNYCKQEKMPLYTIRINRYDKDGLPYKNPLMTEDQLNHISECELDDFPTDFIVDNNSQPGIVEQAAHMIIRQILPNSIINT